MRGAAYLYLWLVEVRFSSPERWPQAWSYRMVCSVSTTDSSGQSDYEDFQERKTLQDEHADSMESAVVALLEALGEDITREGLRETPRVRLPQAA